MRNTRGFTLVEVLMAAAIVAMIILSIATMFLTAYGNVQWGGEQTVAATLGQQRIEWLRNQTYADLAAGSTAEQLTGEYAGYSRTTEIQVGTPTVRLKQVTVTVATPGGRLVKLTSLIAK